MTFGSFSRMIVGSFNSFLELKKFQMKILFSWLKEFLELSLSPEALADLLTLGGAEVTSLSRVEDDWLFELEITPNRPDLLSHLGMARESAALLGRPFRFPRWLKREMVYPQEG